MKRIITLLSLILILASCGKDSQPSKKAYYGQWYKSQSWIASNFKMYFQFNEGGTFVFRSETDRDISCTPVSGSKQYTDNGETISLNDFTVECTPLFSKYSDKIVFHSAKWDTSGSGLQFAKMVVSYTYTESNFFTGEKKDPVDLTCVFSVTALGPQ